MREVIVYGEDEFTRDNPEKAFTIDKRGVNCYRHDGNFFIIYAEELEAIYKAYQKEKDGDNRRKPKARKE